MPKAAQNQRHHRSPQPRAQSRQVLVRAIEEKVHHLSFDRLKQLAAELGVEEPGAESKPAPVIEGSGLGPLVSLEEGEARLDEITVDDLSTDWAATELLGAGEMAKRLDVARATLDNWRTANKVIAFRKGVRNYVYPTRQFERFGPVEGLDRVVGVFPSPEEAWEWLVTPNRYTNDEAPIDRLRARHINEVARAAEGAHDFG
jgi:hypothetical protein